MDNKHSLELLSNVDQDIIVDNLSLTDQRSVAFHLLYAAEAFDYDVSLESIVDNFSKGYNLIVPVESPIFKQVQAIITERKMLDDYIKPYLANWRFERIGVATKLILRFAFWEFLHTSLDPVVIINEAIELAKCFAEKDAFKFVNGILDKYVKNLEQDHNE